MENNTKDLRVVELEVRCENPKNVSILHVIHALNDAYYGRDAIISDYYNDGVPEDSATIDVTNIKTCLDAIVELSNILGLMSYEIESQLPITLIDVGGTDECRYLKEDQILWVVYSIEELKTINPSFWINVENLSAPSITGNDKHFNFSNRYQTLETLKKSIGFDTIDFALEYCYYMNNLFNVQAIKRRDILVNALANTKILIKSGEYDIECLDNYIADKVFMRKTPIGVIRPDDVFGYLSAHNPDRVINIEEKEYSFLEIFKFISEDKWYSVDFYLKRYYSTTVHQLISNLEDVKKKRQ